MAENKGKIDAEAAQRMLTDHYDTYDKKLQPNERTICGHIDQSPRGVKDWQPPYAPAGAVQNKVADSAMVARMSMYASAGHACGVSFRVSQHLKKYPQFAHLKGMLKDMPSEPWTLFEASPGR